MQLFVNAMHGRGKVALLKTDLRGSHRYQYLENDGLCTIGYNGHVSDPGQSRIIVLVTFLTFLLIHSSTLSIVNLASCTKHHSTEFCLSLCVINWFLVLVICRSPFWRFNRRSLSASIHTYIHIFI